MSYRLHDAACKSHVRLKPLDKLDDMWVLEGLEHIHLIQNVLTLDVWIILPDDLDGYLSHRSYSLSNKTKRTRPDCYSEQVVLPVYARHI